MSEDDIKRVIASFGDSARRAREAGFQVLEVYAAHGFLIHQFLSPIANQRTDAWGGDSTGRRGFAIEWRAPYADSGLKTCRSFSDSP